MAQAAIAKAAFPSADEIKKYVEAADKAVDVADKTLNFLVKLKGEVANMTNDRSMIINASGNNKTVQFYVYNTVAPIKLTTQFNFASQNGHYTEVHCNGFGGMKVFIDNKQPGWGVDRNKVYIYDGNGINLLLSKDALSNKLQKIKSK